MKVLFIGGTGAVSSACARLCAQCGIDLTLLLRGSRDHRVPPGVKVVHGDIKRDPGAVHALLSNHFWDSVVDWVAYEEGDILRDVELFRDRTAQFVFISSTSAYHKPLPSPWVTEATPIGNRFWAYADNKARCERLLASFMGSGGFPATVVRPGAVYAEFTLPTGIAGLGYGLVQRAREGKPIPVHGDGTGWWTFTFNEDFARAFIPLLGMESAKGETFHIVSGEFHSWLGIYDMIADVFGFDPTYVFAPSRLFQQHDSELGATLLGDKAHSYLFDVSKIRSYVPASTPRVDLRQGLQRCRDWFEGHQNEVTTDPVRQRLLDQIVESARRSEVAGVKPGGTA